MLGLTDRRNYADIADAIRERVSTNATWLPSELAGAIRAMPMVASPQDVTSTYVTGPFSASATSAQPIEAVALATYVARRQRHATATIG